jgi:LmbE family N-acetylglucosaminyl deacetylase
MRVVCISAHQDDEMGCLGTLVKYRKRGDAIVFVCVTNGNKGMSFRPDIPLSQAAEIRRAEMRHVAEELGADYRCLEREDGFVEDDRQLRVDMIEVLRDVSADLVFTHWTSDYNRDHVVTARVVTDAALFSGIPSFSTSSASLDRPPAIYYMDPGDGYGFDGTSFVELDDVTVNRKAELIRLHETQNSVVRSLRPDGRDFADLAIATAERVGARALVRYAEVFRPCLEDRRVPLCRHLP